MIKQQMQLASRKLQEGKIGYVLGWLVGIPIPLLILFWFFFDR